MKMQIFKFGKSTALVFGNSEELRRFGEELSSMPSHCRVAFVGTCDNDVHISHLKALQNRGYVEPWRNPVLRDSKTGEWKV
jgi:hypothetical protein